MANIDQTLNELMTVDGAMAAAIVDYSSGMLLGSIGAGMDLEVAAGGNTEVVRAKMKVISMLGLDDEIEDILITLGKQYHLIRPLATDRELFIYFVLDRSRSNLALGRRKLQQCESALTI